MRRRPVAAGPGAPAAGLAAAFFGSTAGPGAAAGPFLAAGAGAGAFFSAEDGAGAAGFLASAPGLAAGFFGSVGAGAATHILPHHCIQEYNCAVMQPVLVGY